MKTTVVINTKGGVGKTTVSTNLASYFAANHLATTIMDYDPQGSSLHWLEQRPATLAKIHGANASQPTTGLRSFRMHVPAATEHLIIDAPAGASRLLQQDMLKNADHVLIPVGSSAIDIHATAGFIKELLLAGRVRTHGIRVGVIANRAREGKPIYAPLERFLNSLHMPFLTRLHDSEAYISAAETGVGIFEMDPAVSEKERREFMPIVEWITGTNAAVAKSNVIQLSSARKLGGTNSTS